MAQNSGKTNGFSAPSDPLREEYSRQLALFDCQPPIVQRFLEAQGHLVGEAFTEQAPRLRFTLPDRVVMTNSDEPQPVPQTSREQAVGRLFPRLTRQDVRPAIKQRLTELEQSTDPALAVSGGLLRFAAVQHIVHKMLPAGRSVIYETAEGDEIATIPVGRAADPESALTAETDAIVEAGKAEEGRGRLQVPYVPAARRFYLPQWVAFDDQGKLLVSSTAEAEAHIASMQRFLEVLFGARSLAPYIVADESFERKRYGMLGQLVNQGRALALHMTGEIVATIKRRAAAGSLNRGLNLSLPYFDDQDLLIQTYRFTIIPAGRIMFVPAFVVRAAIEEQAKVAQDTRLNPSTRKHLLIELSLLAQAFTPRGK
ncbi:MAG: hypothetical protein JXB85_16445 [Anaerolineales bacterium]|nr:hypothetical protein [Anaerolineales bacterium]